MIVTDPDTEAKKLIELGYQLGEKLGLAQWNEDEAGPFQTIPYPGENWQPEGEPQKQPHEYIRNGTAKLVTLFHPATAHEVCFEIPKMAIVMPIAPLVYH